MQVPQREIPKRTFMADVTRPKYQYYTHNPDRRLIV